MKKGTYIQGDSIKSTEVIEVIEVKPEILSEEETEKKDDNEEEK